MVVSAEGVNALKTLLDKMGCELFPASRDWMEMLRSWWSGCNVGARCYKIMERKQWIFSFLKCDHRSIFSSHFSGCGTSEVKKIKPEIKTGSGKR